MSIAILTTKHENAGSQSLPPRWGKARMGVRRGATHPRNDEEKGARRIFRVIHGQVGLEDNLYVSRGKLATDAQLVKKVATNARELGREVATPAQEREMPGLSQTPKQY